MQGGQRRRRRGRNSRGGKRQGDTGRKPRPLLVPEPPQKHDTKGLLPFKINLRAEKRQISTRVVQRNTETGN